MLTYQTLASRPAQLQAMTSLRRDEFEALLPHFAEAYAATQPADKNQAGQPRKRKPGGGRKGQLASLADKLLFSLVYQKTYPLQVAHGLQFWLSQPQTNDWIHRLHPVLTTATERAGYAPARDGLPASGPRALQLDGTERPRQRPQAATPRQTHYSGKKTTHR